jgi:hypothetical protein
MLAFDLLQPRHRSLQTISMYAVKGVVIGKVAKRTTLPKTLHPVEPREALNR